MKRHLRRHSLALAISTLMAGSAAAQIETVIVTAEFRETDVQDTPVAITAISGDMLEARAQTSVFQVAAQAPNVSLRPGGQARSGMLATIRGIGQSDFIAAVEPGVGVYVDDVYYSQLTGSLLDLLDLSRVEILRGPQGTLAGRNSIGGAIRLYSTDAGTDEGGRVMVGYGSFNQIDVRGMADLELSPGKLYARFAGASRERDGHVDVIDYACSHPGSGVPTNAYGRPGCKLDEWGSQNYVTGRANLRWTPSDRMSVDFIVDLLNDDSGTAAATLSYADRTGIEASGAAPILSIDDGDGANLVYYRDHIFVPYGQFRNANDPVNDPYVAYGTLTDPYIRMPTTAGVDTVGGTVGAVVPWKPLSLPSRNALDHRGFSINLTWDITDMMSLTWISAYRDYETWMTWDSDVSPIPVTMLDNYLTHDQRSQELRLTGGTDRFDYTVGAFYFDQYTDYAARVDLNYAVIDFVHGPDPTPATTWAVFGNATWHITDALNISVGARYSDELKDYTHHRHNPDGTNVAGFPNLVNIRLSNVDGLTARFEDTRTDWRAAVDYNLGDSAMVYGSAATGYKSGGVNPRPFFPVQLNVFNPETMTSYEVGFKSMLAENSVRLNAAYFTTDYEDIQLILTRCQVPLQFDTDGVADGISAPCLQPSNVGNAEVSGIELELEWFITNDLLLDASVSTLDFQYTELKNSAALTGSTIAPIDMITPYTPELQWALGLQYGFDMSNGGRLNMRLDASFTDDVYADPTNHPLNVIEGYTLTNARIWWESQDEGWEIALEIRNLTDELYYHDLYDQRGSVGQVQLQPALPRTWYVSASRNF
jgi:iron complex outermembrane receptor protein